MEFFVILGGYDKGFYGNLVWKKSEKKSDLLLFADIKSVSLKISLIFQSNADGSSTSKSQLI